MCKVPENDEIFGAIQEMSNNKAAGADKIPAEVYKYGGQLLAPKIGDLIRDCWRQELFLKISKMRILYMCTRKRR